jgi:hypothetical protein
MRMLRAMAAGTLAATLFAGAALAAPVHYSWTGYGINVQGSSKCPSYKMTIDVFVDGDEVKGTFQQEGRPERTFQTTLDNHVGIKTAAMVGGGGMMDVIGTIKEGEAKIMLNGYCKFEGPLTKK